MIGIHCRALYDDVSHTCIFLYITLSDMALPLSRTPCTAEIEDVVMELVAAKEASGTTCKCQWDISKLTDENIDRIKQDTDGPIQQTLLLHNIGLTALELIGLAIGSIVLSSVENCLWIWNGAVIVRELRGKVYQAVFGKDSMVWLDCRMGSK